MDLDPWGHGNLMSNVRASSSETAYGGNVPGPPNIKGLMVSIVWYLGCLKG